MSNLHNWQSRASSNFQLSTTGFTTPSTGRNWTTVCWAGNIWSTYHIQKYQFVSNSAQNSWDGEKSLSHRQERFMMLYLYLIHVAATWLKAWKYHRVHGLGYIGGPDLLIPWLNFGTNPGYFFPYINRMSARERPYVSHISAVCLPYVCCISAVSLPYVSRT